MALLAALERHGRELGDPWSHPIVTARYDTHALRRTPPTPDTPQASKPPVIRVIYSFVDTPWGDHAVVLKGGDKTELGSMWYPPNVQEAEYRLEDHCRRNKQHRPLRRRPQ